MESNTFCKAEKLCSKILVDQLFGSKSSSFCSWPIRAVFQVVDSAGFAETPHVMLLLSVSKRHFKRAVKRNRVKRQLREAYRKNKSVLSDVMAQMPDKRLLLAFIWQDDKLYESAKVEHKVEALLQRLAEKLVSSLEHNKLPDGKTDTTKEQSSYIENEHEGQGGQDI